MTESETATDRLTVSRYVPATPAEAYAAWTQPELFVAWWGPAGVRCVAAELDVRVGQSYRIGNELPDGTMVWISGRYLEVRSPAMLRYTWVVEPNADVSASSIVTVTFSAEDEGTRVVVTHERIASPEIRENHLAGWLGCLDGLVDFLDSKTD